MLQQTATVHGAMERISFILWITVVAAFGLPQPSNSATKEDLIEAAKKEREVVFYTTTNLEEAGAMSARFKARYPFLEVNITRAEGERLTTKVLQETRAKKSLVDVMQTPAFYLDALKKRGLLGRIRSRTTTVFTRAASKTRNIGLQPITIPTWFFTTPSSSPDKTCPSATTICSVLSGKIK